MGESSNSLLKFRQPLSEPLQRTAPMRHGTPARVSMPESVAPKPSASRQQSPAQAAGERTTSIQRSAPQRSFTPPSSRKFIHRSASLRSCTPPLSQSQIFPRPRTPRRCDTTGETISQSGRRAVTPSRPSSEVARPASQGAKNELSKIHNEFTTGETICRSGRHTATPCGPSSRRVGARLPASAKGVLTHDLVEKEMKDKRRLLQRQREENYRRMLASHNGPSIFGF